jgi:hypothetical protein
MTKIRFNIVAMAAFCLLAGCSSSAAPASQSATVPSGYDDLCAADGIKCQTGDTPLNLKGTYSGTGTVVVTSNALWNVGNTGQFTAVIATQDGQSGSGSFEMDSYRLDVPHATIRGSGNDFTIYGVDTATNTDPDAGAPTNCTVEARGVVTGTQASTNGAITLSGKMTLEFTQNITGSGCTEDMITKYPGTGATFDFTATRSQ